MYCSSCGLAVTPGLSYCNRCGALLSPKERQESTPEVPPEYLIWSILAVTVGGLGLIIGLMAVMKRALNFSTELIVGFSLLSFLLILAAESVFIWKLVGSRSRGREGTGAQRLENSERKTAPVSVRILGDAAPTVTEHTTRELERAELIKPVND